MGRDARRLRQRADPAAGLRLSDQTHYREGALVRKGAGAVRDRRASVRSRRSRRPSAQLAQAQAAARPHRTRRRARHAAREGARDSRRASSTTTSRRNLAAQAAVKSAQAAVDTAQAEPRVHQGALAHRRRRRDRHGADRRSRRARRRLLTTVSQVDPIRAYFSLSEQEYLARRRADQSARPARKSLWKTGAALTLTLADGTEYPAAGRVSRRRSADRSDDRHDSHQRDRSPIRSRLLRPGQYGRVTRRNAGAEERAARAAARGHRAAGRVAAARRRRGRQGAAPHRDARRARRQPLDRRPTDCSRRPRDRRRPQLARHRRQDQTVSGAAEAVARPDGGARWRWRGDHRSPRQRRIRPATRRAGARSRTAEAGDMAAFFIRRPIVAIVIAIVTVLARPRVDAGAADRAVPGHRAAADHRHRHLHRRRRA